ncbi:hypothetical protein HYDPIDRAFT_33037 [Hydnomerulius pinastri MD-312]|uniref:Uncharacterized protein n=1 Tax=Hydnomerulius pinastri MD-312 TaxID=994086 RepID=A0A0C9W9M1_9AGAM|nr:hypothetical protein HYDPIDRAFT_33037 [Hydnomerulius pinastri MD-312]
MPAYRELPVSTSTPLYHFHHVERFMDVINGRFRMAQMAVISRVEDCWVGAQVVVDAFAKGAKVKHGGRRARKSSQWMYYEHVGTGLDLVRFKHDVQFNAENYKTLPPSPPFSSVSGLKVRIGGVERDPQIIASRSLEEKHGEVSRHPIPLALGPRSPSRRSARGS